MSSTVDVSYDLMSLFVFNIRVSPCYLNVGKTEASKIN
jgi:hypothetical protein